MIMLKMVLLYLFIYGESGFIATLWFLSYILSYSILSVDSYTNLALKVKAEYRNQGRPLVHL